MDPAAPSPLTDDVRINRKLAELDRRITELLTGGRPPIGNGPPTADPTKLTEGTEYIDRTNRRKYYVIGDGVSAATNVWRYGALT